VAGELGIPVFALAGSLGPGFGALYRGGLTAAFAIADGPMSLDEATGNAERLLTAVAESVMRCWSAAGGDVHA
jgi:glycerate kinase